MTPTRSDASTVERITGLRPATPTLGRSMKSTVEPLEGNKVKLSVEVGESEFDKEVDAAFKRIAREVRIPGFRPGKAPRRILEARVGTEAARADALQHALPEYYAQAVTEHEVDVIAAPEIDITVGRDGGRRRLRRRRRGPAPDHRRRLRQPAGRRSSRPRPPTRRSTHRIDHLREQFAELVTVSTATPATATRSPSTSPARRTASRCRASPPRATGTWSAAARSSPSSTSSSPGRRSATSSQFTADHPDPEQDPVDFRVLVKEVAEQKLPDARRRLGRRGLRVRHRRRAAGRHRPSGSGWSRRSRRRWPSRRRPARPSPSWSRTRCPSRSSTPRCRTGSRTSPCASRPRAWTSASTSRPPAATRRPSSAELRETATQAVKVDLALRAVAEAEGTEVDRRGPRGRVRGRRRAGRPEARAGAQAVRAQRADAVGTLRHQEAQGPRVAAGAGRGGR